MAPLKSHFEIWLRGSLCLLHMYTRSIWPNPFRLVTIVDEDNLVDLSAHIALDQVLKIAPASKAKSCSSHVVTAWLLSELRACPLLHIYLSCGDKGWVSPATSLAHSILPRKSAAAVTHGKLLIASAHGPTLIATCKHALRMMTQHGGTGSARVPVLLPGLVNTESMSCAVNSSYHVPSVSSTRDLGRRVGTTRT